MYHVTWSQIAFENESVITIWYFWNFKRRLWRHPRIFFPVFSRILGQKRTLFRSSTKQGVVNFWLRIPYWNSSLASALTFLILVVSTIFFDEITTEKFRQRTDQITNPTRPDIQNRWSVPTLDSVSEICRKFCSNGVFRHLKEYPTIVWGLFYVSGLFWGEIKNLVRTRGDDIWWKKKVSFQAPDRRGQ